MTTTGVPSQHRNPAPRQVRLPADTSAAHAARAAVGALLAELGVSGPLADDILLVTSELVTNALEHGGGAQLLEVDRDGKSLTLRVHDRIPTHPRRGQPDPLTERSRGLLLVNALATDWGHRAQGSGKIVWARFDLTAK